MNKKISVLFFALLAVMSLSAQQVEKLPIDEAVRVGHLDNGLTYYIRHNEQPKQRCEFHIAQAVGAVLEEDNQNGLAHFLEHMAFNGTEHFPGKLIIEYFESIGVNFGGNINAYTSIDETVYRLSDVPTIREGIIDSALLVMHDWASAISLLGEEIDNERGVIREEWRTGATAQRRLWKQMRQQKYPGSQYGKRDVIGDTAVINNFSYDALRAYYHKWYGPDNQAIIVVGDIDVDAIEAKIKALWADVPARANRGERPLHTVEIPTAPRVCFATDPEAQQSQLHFEFLHEQMPEQYRGTNMEYIQNICHSLIGQMMNNRTDELKMDPKAPFIYDYFDYDEIVKLKDGFLAISIPKEGQETEAYRDLCIQLEKMRRFGFTESEMERAKTAYLNMMEESYNARNTRDNISYAREYIRNFEDGEAIPGIEYELNLVKAVLPMLDVQSLNKIATMYIHENPIIAIQGPDKAGVNLPDAETCLRIWKEVQQMELEAPKEEKINTVLVKKAPKKGKVKTAAYNESIDVTEWTLKNGIRVIIKPTTFKDNEISMYAFSKGGKAMLAPEDLISADIISNNMEFMGLGQFSMTELEKALTGKTAYVGASINNNTESVSGSCSVKDLETLLQLTYLTFTAPRRDEQAYETLISLFENQLRNKESNPKAIFRDSISMMQTCHSPRTVLLNMETLGQASLDRGLEIYKERIMNPKDFTFLFIGQIDPKNPATRKLIEQWIGGLKTCKGTIEDFRDNGVRAPKGVVKNYFDRQMQIHTASNRIQYTSYEMPYSLANELNMEMIGRILSTRYLESIREREGGSYGVGCWGTMYEKPVPYALLVMQFDTDPEKQEKLMGIIHDEVKTIIENGPLASDLQKEKESMLKDFQEQLEDNEWWENTLFMYYAYGQNLYADYKAAVEAITAETVQKTLQQLVAAGNMFEVVMTPAE